MDASKKVMWNVCDIQFIILILFNNLSKKREIF